MPRPLPIALLPPRAEGRPGALPQAPAPSPARPAPAARWPAWSTHRLPRPAAALLSRAGAGARSWRPRLLAALRWRLMTALLSSPALAFAPLASAQVANDSQRPWWVQVAATGQADSELDDGGELRTRGLALGAGRQWAISPATQLQADLRYQFDDWTFSDATVLGHASPWDEVHRLRTSFGVQHALDASWQLGARLLLGATGEDGADLGDSVSVGGLVAVSRRWGQGLRLGLAVGATRDIEDTRVLIAPIVSWRLSPTLTLQNTGLDGAGAGGLELLYQPSARWSVALGAAAERQRFRLDDRGPLGDAIVESRSVPVFLRATWLPSPATQWQLAAGWKTDAELRLEDRDGDGLSTQGLESAPFLRLQWLQRF